MKKDKEAKKKKKEKSAQVSVPETVKTVSPETEDAILETLLQHIGGKWKIRIIWALQNAQPKLKRTYGQRYCRASSIPRNSSKSRISNYTKRACINSHIPGLHFLGRIIWIKKWNKIKVKNSYKREWIGYNLFILFYIFCTLYEIFKFSLLIFLHI